MGTGIHAVRECNSHVAERVEGRSYLAFRVGRLRQHAAWELVSKPHQTVRLWGKVRIYIHGLRDADYISDSQSNQGLSA